MGNADAVKKLDVEVLWDLGEINGADCAQDCYRDCWTGRSVRLNDAEPQGFS